MTRKQDNRSSESARCYETELRGTERPGLLWASQLVHMGPFSIAARVGSSGIPWLAGLVRDLEMAQRLMNREAHSLLSAPGGTWYRITGP